MAVGILAPRPTSTTSGICAVLPVFCVGLHVHVCVPHVHLTVCSMLLVSSGMSVVCLCLYGLPALHTRVRVSAPSVCWYGMLSVSVV